MSTLGVVGASHKAHERRVPIHPLHLGRIDADCRRPIYFERGYGERFDVSDDALGLLPVWVVVEQLPRYGGSRVSTS